jgi:hypothetical protein
MQTLIMILVSLGMGIGGTLLVQTVIITPPPVVAVVACPEPVPETAQSPGAFGELPVSDYVPQGRLLKGIRNGDGPWR